MGVLTYPVYVRVTYGRNNHKIKSEWLNHPISEKEFEENKKIKNLIEYESKVIIEILTNGNEPENANLLSRLRYSTEPVSECFLGWTLDVKDIKEQIIKYIINKTELKERIIAPFVRLDFIDSNGWIELAEKGVFKGESKQKALFIAMLKDFEDMKYPDSGNEYEVSCIFNFYEWRMNNGKKNFIDYTKERKLLTELEVSNIIQLFDKHIIQWSSFDMRG